MSAQTEGAVLFSPDRPLGVVSLSLPDLKPGQVLVDVSFSGICGSQLLEVRGKRGPDPHLPHALGHEGSGRIVDVGTGVTKVKPGDTVVLSWIKGSGADVSSTIYTGPKGPVNSGAISTLVRRTIISENRVTPISNKMPLREAALLGCAVPTGAGAVMNTAKIHSDSSIAIFGVGGIGLSAVMMANLMNATTIIAVDVLDYKLELAHKLGATHLINASQQEPSVVIPEITRGQGVDYSIEASGRQEAMEMAFKVVRDNGGLCVLVGNLSYAEHISLDPFDLIRGKRIVGTWGGETQPDRDIPIYVDLYVSGKLDLSALITHEYRLHEINQAFDDLQQGKVGRALVSMV